MLSAGKTDVGKVRQNNEDSLLISNEPVGVLPNLFVVADGMGGHKAGEVASSLAIKYCCEYLTNNAEGRGEILDTLIDAVRFANAMVHELGLKDESYSNMGTTFTSCCISGGKAYIAHVGDSRLYKINANETERVTTDHSYVEEMLRAGRITPEEAENHPDRNIITRALGTDGDVKADGTVIDVKQGDMLLICSDGLNTMLKDAEIADILNSDLLLQQKADRLVEAANEKGGRDNISVILICFEEGDEL
jgi:protein phosphatase